MSRVATSADSHAEITESGATTVVRLVGEFDLEATGPLGRELSEPVNLARDLVVDVTAIGLIDSSSLGVLITAERRTTFRGGRFALVVGDATSPTVRASLRLAGLLRTTETYPTVDRALAALAPAEA